MSLAPELSTIHPSVDTQPFWDACRQRELRFQRCVACARFRHPPMPGCPHCGSADSEWVRVAGVGRVFSYTLIHHASVPVLQEHLPYNVVLIEFDDAPGVRLISNLIDGPHEPIDIGMQVEVTWEEAAPGVILPRFHRASRPQ